MIKNLLKISRMSFLTCLTWQREKNSEKFEGCHGQLSKLQYMCINIPVTTRATVCCYSGEPI
ncbi:hypothetical protein NQ317_013675 [Molorchus minor]|uniref:Uncharacterized protein n=1 Tax=Molorchus minor TaxID=1323400 RepID=A0ABQ9JCJ4_9CUCU|nr:hypothetical protein NQ317_013675 [Molorchus minor]